MAQEAGAITQDFCVHEDLGWQRLEGHYENISTLCTALKDRIAETPPRELARAVTGAVTEAYLTGKALGAAHTFCEASKLKALDFAEKVRAGEQIAVTAEGIQVRIASKASETLAKMEQAGEKLKGMPARIGANVSSKIKDIGATKQAIKSLMAKKIVPQDIGRKILQTLDRPRCNMHDLITKSGKHKWIPESFKEFVISNEKIELLSKAFGKFIGYEHIFAPEFMFNCEKNIIESVAGWHHDHLGKLLNSGKLQIRDLVKGPHGTYEVWWSYGGSEFKPSTFFPSSWSEAKVLSKIEEAMANVIKTDIVGPKRVVIGVTSEGIKVRAIFRTINDTCEKMITAHPEFK